jgi:hypothetical protein
MGDIWYLWFIPIDTLKLNGYEYDIEEAEQYAGAEGKKKYKYLKKLYIDYLSINLKLYIYL